MFCDVGTTDRLTEVTKFNAILFIPYIAGMTTIGTNLNSRTTLP